MSRIGNKRSDYFCATCAVGVLQILSGTSLLLSAGEIKPWNWANAAVEVIWVVVSAVVFVLFCVGKRLSKECLSPLLFATLYVLYFNASFVLEASSLDRHSVNVIPTWGSIGEIVYGLLTLMLNVYLWRTEALADESAQEGE